MCMCMLVYVCMCMLVYVCMCVCVRALAVHTMIVNIFASMRFGHEYFAWHLMQ